MLCTIMMSRFLAPVLSARLMTPMTSFPTLILELTSSWSCPGPCPVRCFPQPVFRMRFFACSWLCSFHPLWVRSSYPLWVRSSVIHHGVLDLSFIVDHTCSQVKFDHDKTRSGSGRVCRHWERDANERRKFNGAVHPVPMIFCTITLNWTANEAMPSTLPAYPMTRPNKRHLNFAMLSRPCEQRATTGNAGQRSPPRKSYEPDVHGVGLVVERSDTPWLDVSGHEELNQKWTSRSLPHQR